MLPLVKEWYSDIPWHQKLGTFAGNEIDEALVLPYDALGAQEKAFCTSKNLKQEDCMLELGVNNILGMLRTDTLYAPQDPKIKAAPSARIRALPCIEVMLELSSFWTRSTGSAVALQPRPFGTGQRRIPDGSDMYRRVHHHGRQHLRPPDALVHVALLRFTLPGHGTMSRILFATVTIFPR